MYAYSKQMPAAKNTVQRKGAAKTVPKAAETSGAKGSYSGGLSRFSIGEGYRCSASQGVAQLAKKAYAASRPRRPSFSSKTLRGAALIRDRRRTPFHLAHRLSFSDIRAAQMEAMTGRRLAQRRFARLTKAIMIPARDYGTFKQGDTTLYDRVMSLQKLGDHAGVLSSLNSSPFNLRPGDPTTNMEIKEHMDLHHEDEDPARPLTPISQGIYGLGFGTPPLADPSNPGYFMSSDFTGVPMREQKETEEDLTRYYP